ncbi:methylated-DNA--[protein]-cysteine S-methyltransferase [Neptunomonas japonica]|uniref:methylated-DNA--[protein]-cysteine S-methyltransferase n=1 Tax=Neptunomonas japonica TaxID=417574 RepID=UPI000403034E|nr:methylated-DNA--[protein]-cysteine S-methyltransferase [Neptunomonas japonica]
MITYCTWTSPFGEMLATAEKQQLTGCYKIGQKYQPEISAQWSEASNEPIFVQLKQQLERFAVNPDTPFDLALQPKGTAFQQSVWQALLQIPAGQTRYYQQLANSLDRPKSTRAVAAAIGKNPLIIIIPCHRVVGKNGNLTGFAGGLDMKRKLLDLEASNSNF